MPRNALLVEIDDEDLDWAERQNRYQCAIVRAIQRKIPTALRVTADVKHISFSLPEDDVRYTFDTPKDVVEKVIKPFDLGERPAVEDRSFVLSVGDTKPIRHIDSAKRLTKNAAQRRQRNRDQRVRSVNPAVRTFNRFLDAEAEE